MKNFCLAALGLVACLLIAPMVFSQGAGSAYSNYPNNPYGNQGYGTPAPSHPVARLDRKMAQEVISIEGVAEIKLEPEKIRLVFGLISESETAKQCSEKIEALCSSTTSGLLDAGLAESDINKDFISVTPVFEWKEATLETEKAIKQERTGFQMQSNFHVLCKNEAEAMKVIDIAFENGISDIIAFDYWSSQIDKSKEEARALAIKAAQTKARSMFGAFELKPQPLNIEEKTSVHKPASLYRSFSNANMSSISLPRNWRDRPQIFAARPKLTYLENLNEEKDINAKTPAMKPEIIVLSKVTTYYAVSSK